MPRVAWAILADYAQVSLTQQLHVIGGGWDTGYRPHFPHQFLGALAVRVLFTRQETGRQHQVELHIVDEDGQAIVPPAILAIQGQVVPAFPHGWDIPVMFVANFHNLNIPRPGRYAINIMIGDRQEASVPFQFVQGPIPLLGQPGTPPAQPPGAGPPGGPPGSG